MTNTYTTSAMKIYSSIGALTGWFAVLLQLYLIIENRTMSVPATIVRFLSFFTILTNILVAVGYTALVFPSSRWGRFFSRPQVLTAVTLYILVVGIVYNLILRFTWAPQGWQKLADELLHSVTPVMFLLFWIVFVPKRSLRIRDVFPWLIYPALYLVYTLIRGAVTGFYPYPFVDVNALGYPQVLFNSGILVLVFLGLALGMVAPGKLGKRNKE